MAPVLLACWIPAGMIWAAALPALGIAVADVVQGGAEKKMVRPNTTGDIAAVTNLQLGRYDDMEVHFIRNPVRLPHSSTPADGSVSLGMLRASPKPAAGVVCHNLGPEAAYIAAMRLV